MSEQKLLNFRGFPLLRQGNLIYYGNITDKYIIMMQIMDSTKVKDLEQSTKVLVQLQHTDPNIRARNRVLKKSEKKGLYEAMDLASVWLTRALSE
ncbi:MAG: hypothetical protein GX257_03255 [Clostridiales bacterium]|jgi:hypothetical protein|nr:hypothetical protein [Clostridiales bacterium]